MPIEKSRYESAIEHLLLHGKQLDLIYNTVIDVLYMLDVEPGEKFKFTSVNRSFLQVTGLKEDQVIGKYVDEVIPPSR
ncbi:MAG: domain S-box-containing protein [Sphingobacteriaceae bacterium]|jgi:PAS domain S-box-containing protein|nr:domain S-box-containing protein [Sphingobacteriaceae bacterium]